MTKVEMKQNIHGMFRKTTTSLLHRDTTHSSPSLVTISSTRPSLTKCDLLITILECYMMERIRQNEIIERAEERECKMYGRKMAEPSVFHALHMPSITPIEYLRRLDRYAYCSRAVFITAFYFLDKIANMKNVGLRINSLSVHRLLLTAVLLSTKVMDDVLYDNAHFAKVGGLGVKELNELELDLLKVLEFKLHITPKEFEAFEKHLLERALATTDGDYSKLPNRLRNSGYDVETNAKLTPLSPTSSMDVNFGV